MKKEEFAARISEKLKLIRTEKGYSQEEMASVLGISKKTLIYIEKGRGKLNWGTAAAAAVIFEDSEIVDMILGGDTVETVKSIAFDYYENYPATMGGKIWWTDIETENGYRLQQNIVSKHYRILTEKDCRVCSSFDREHMKRKLSELCKTARGDDKGV